MVSSQLIGCITILAGIFAALILVAGSRDAQIVTGLLVVIAIALAVPAARGWVRRVRRDERKNVLNAVEQRARAAQAGRRAETLPVFDRLGSHSEVPE